MQKDDKNYFILTWLTRRRGETSTAWRRTVPARPIRVESSRGPELIIAVTRIWKFKDVKLQI